MSINDAGVFVGEIDYTPMKNKPSLSDQYDAGVLANKPFTIRHFENATGRKRIKTWYFDHTGQLISKPIYKYYKAKARRCVVLAFNDG